MKIEVLQTAQQANPSICKGKNVAVIDVLRATSVIVTALANGANRVYPVASIEDAFKKIACFPSSTALLGGEREGKIINGFDIGNSPLTYTPEKIAAKNIVLSTSNGTLALHNSKQANRLFAVSFVNLRYAAKILAQEAAPLLIVCSGTNGKFSMDDALCAGMLIDEINTISEVEYGDFEQVLLQYYQNKQLTISEKLANCKHVNYLQSIGYADDITYCFQTNIFEVLPEYHPDGYLAI